MAFEESVAERVRDGLSRRAAAVEKKMLGGLAFLVRGHMCCGVVGRRLMIRVGPDAHAAALARPHAKPMDFTGEPLAGFAFVEPAGFAKEADLATWLDSALAFVTGLPEKTKAGAGKRR